MGIRLREDRGWYESVYEWRIVSYAMHRQAGLNAQDLEKVVFYMAAVDKTVVKLGRQLFDEMRVFLQGETDLVDYNHTDLLFEDLRLPDAVEQAVAGRAVTKKEFTSIDWSAFLNRQASLHPHRFARDYSQTWLKYSQHDVLKYLLKKVAAVTGLPHELVRRQAEQLKLLRYGPHGSHNSCHHDGAPDIIDSFRFMTFFLFLNDVQDGGETVLFGTDVNRTGGSLYPHRRTWSESEWEDLETRCQPTGSCPPAGSSQPPAPFDGAVVVRPKLGRALFWYNTEVDAAGRGTRFVWSSLHGGCPTRGGEKWAANVWLHAGPAMEGHAEL